MHTSHTTFSTFTIPMFSYCHDYCYHHHPRSSSHSCVQSHNQNNNLSTVENDYACCHCCCSYSCLPIVRESRECGRSEGMKGGKKAWKILDHSPHSLCRVLLER